jgi:spectinomycin phosphotransferase
MRIRPRSVATQEISAALLTHWEIRPVSLRYLPVGFGSHHWAATTSDGQTWFVTIDDLQEGRLGDDEAASLKALDVAFSTAAALRDVAGLQFIIAPITSRSGNAVVRLTDRYSMTVFPHLEMASGNIGEFRDTMDRDDALRLIAHIHNATNRVGTDGLRRETLVVPHREALMNAIRAAGEPWTGGPFSDPARLLLRQASESVLRRLERFDAIVQAVGRNQDEWVITHGEPHAANVVRTGDGEMVIVDWDTVALAPRERDLWMLVSDDHPEWKAYRDLTRVPALSRDILVAYRLHWELSEIAIYIDWFRNLHERTEDMEIGWESLKGYLAG